MRGRDGSPDVKVQHEQVAAPAWMFYTSFRTLFWHGLANSRFMMLGVGVHSLGLREAKLKFRKPQKLGIREHSQSHQGFSETNALSDIYHYSQTNLLNDKRYELPPY